jgi:hypothetical protein
MSLALVDEVELCRPVARENFFCRSVVKDCQVMVFKAGDFGKEVPAFVMGSWG